MDLYKALVELGIELDFIVSSSIGALTGAFIAAGMGSAELESHWKSLQTSDVIGPRRQFLRLLVGASSAFSNGNLRNLLRRILPVRSFDELQICLAIVTTDLETGETIVLTECDLIDAILASTALPGLFPPIAWRGRRLVDGGLSNNVPIDLAIERGADQVIGMLCGCTRGSSLRSRTSRPPQSCADGITPCLNEAERMVRFGSRLDIESSGKEELRSQSASSSAKVQRETDSDSRSQG